MSRDITPFALRMPPELRSEVERSARDAGRSLNSEILSRIEQSFASSNLDSMGMMDLMTYLRGKAEEQGLRMTFTIQFPDANGNFEDEEQKEDED